MKRINLFVLFFILMQSCHVYKPVSIPEIKKGKTYEITLKNGRSIKTKCQNINDNSISVLVNEKVLELPKSKIDKVKREKVSVFRLVGGLTIATVGVIVLLNNAEKESLQDKVIDKITN